jgi:hypothetical protein
MNSRRHIGLVILLILLATVGLIAIGMMATQPQLQAGDIAKTKLIVDITNTAIAIETRPQPSQIPTRTIAPNVLLTSTQLAATNRSREAKIMLSRTARVQATKPK